MDPPECFKTGSTILCLMRKNSILWYLYPLDLGFETTQIYLPTTFFFLFQSQSGETVFQKSFFDWKTFFLLFWLFCEPKVHWGSRITSSIQRLRSSPGWRTTFHFRLFFFLEKFKFKLFSTYNNCNYVVCVLNIFFKNLNFGLPTKNIFSVNLSIETRVEAFLDRCCPMDVALCLSCLV